MVTHIHDTLLKSLYSPSPLFPPPPRNAKNMTISIIMTRVSKLFSQVSTINSQSVKKWSAKLATKLRQDMLPLVKSMQKQHPKARLLVLRDFWGEKKKGKSSNIFVHHRNLENYAATENSNTTRIHFTRQRGSSWALWRVQSTVHTHPLARTLGLQHVSVNRVWAFTRSGTKTSVHLAQYSNLVQFENLPLLIITTDFSVKNNDIICFNWNRSLPSQHLHRWDPCFAHPGKQDQDFRTKE